MVLSEHTRKKKDAISIPVLITKPQRILIVSVSAVSRDESGQDLDRICFANSLRVVLHECAVCLRTSGN